MFSLFKRRRTPLLIEEGVNANTRDRLGDRKRPSSLQLCSQLALICACVVILFFGLAVTAVGLWGYFSQEEYLTITDKDTELTRLPFSMMVTGVFVAILGLLGVAGSIFSRTITGQTLLGVFSFVLVLVIISEVGAGAAAIKLHFQLESVFVNAAQKSQMEYSHDKTIAENWDKFQEKYKCCGAKGYVNGTSPYYHAFSNDSVPTSCCKSGATSEECDAYAQNATQFKEHIYDEGCPKAVLGKLTEMITVIAIITIAIGSTQLLAVFLAVLVAYTSSKLDSEKSSYSYNKLLQQEEENDHPIT